MDRRTGSWVQNTNADPRQGYHLHKILHSEIGLAPEEDVYGRLYFFLLSMLKQLHKTIRRHSVRFMVFGSDTMNLPKQLAAHLDPIQRFDRIEASIITDEWSDLNDTFLVFSTLLKHTYENPHATFLTLFTTAIDAAEKELKEKGAKPASNAPYLSSFSESLKISKSRAKVDEAKLRTLQKMAIDKEAMLKEYMRMKDLQGKASRVGLKWKRNNTIVNRWPVGRVHSVVDSGILLRSGTLGRETYIEWARGEDEKGEQPGSNGSGKDRST